MAKLVKVIGEKIAVKDIPKVVIDEEFSESYKVGQGSIPYIRGTPFWISYAKFLILTGDYTRSRIVSLARWTFGPTIGWVIIIIAKIIANTNVNTWEWIMLAIGLIVSGIFYGICYKKTDPRKALLSNMEKHFAENQEELCMGKKNE